MTKQAVKRWAARAWLAFLASWVVVPVVRAMYATVWLTLHGRWSNNPHPDGWMLWGVFGAIAWAAIAIAALVASVVCFDLICDAARGPTKPKEF